ncbi:uncharacterized protein [Hemitrygon akajei]|uniref:uncharacterized protein n=1 Tax=Hemitrygon akajei TaxID=2704970 RepID=UPI003BF9967C
MCTHMKSSLPSLLDAYLPPQLKKQDNKGQQKHPQRDGELGRQRRLSSSDEDEEDLKVKAKRKALEEQHYLEMYKNMYRLCKALRLHYMDLLSKRVQKQRQEIKERDLRFQEKTLKQKVEHNSTRQLFGLHSECSQLHHDIKYLKSVPKSHYYMILQLQDQLVKSGILKNKDDYEDFWQLLKQNSHCSQFETKLQDLKLKMKSSIPHLKTRCAQIKNNHPTNTELPRLPSLQHTNHTKSKQRKVHEESEQMFPKIKNLKQMQETLCHGEVQLDKLYQMYNRSIANMALAGRLLKRSGQFAEFKEPSVQDFVFCENDDTMAKKIQSQQTRHDWFPSQSDSQTGVELIPRSFESHHQEEASEEINAEFTKQHLKQDHNHNAANYYVPLTIEDILPKSNIVEVKHLSNLWTNYVTQEQEILGS